MSYVHEEDTESFRFTRRKKQNRRIELNSSIETPSIQFNQEQLRKNLETKLDHLRSSYFWSQFQHHFTQWLDRQLTSIDILSYGLGHISTSISSQYQYALLKLITQTFESRIVKIYLYDPIWTNDERDFLRNDDLLLKYEILNENNQAFQTIDRVSLIYIPFCSKPIHNNLLYSNWTKEKLREILVFGNSFRRFSHEVQFDSTKFFYIYQSTSFLTEISLPAFDQCVNAFNEQVFTSFDRTTIPLDNCKEIIQTTKREKTKKSNENKQQQLDQITIEQLSQQIWSMNIKPTYTIDDEILIDSNCQT